VRLLIVNNQKASIFNTIIKDTKREKEKRENVEVI